MAQQQIKEPGRFRQLVDVFKRTVQLDKASLWWILAGVALPIVASVFMALTFTGGVLGWILWILVGITTGLMLGMIILGRRAEKAAYSTLEGRAGAVGAVLRAPLRRQFRGSDEPISINPRTLSAVYRIVGAPGVVLIGEGLRSDLNHLMETERKRVAKVASGVPIHAIWVTADSNGTNIREVVKTLNKMKRTLSRAEVKAVHARLATMTLAVPIPKGIDPRKVRASRR